MTTENETPKSESPRPYEPPSVTVLGSLAEMTLGRPGPKSDGINPGSFIR